jgi:hypothetical protein
MPEKPERIEIVRTYKGVKYIDRLRPGDHRIPKQETIDFRRRAFEPTEREPGEEG